MSQARNAPIAMDGAEFKKIGHALVDSIAVFIDSIAGRPVTTGEQPRALQQLLGPAPLPLSGSPTDLLFARATDLLFNHSLLNGHPKFFGYITSSAAPAGALADLVAAAVNPNVGANVLSPMATEIEKQTVSWLAELIGLAPGYGGLLVSGGNMANFTAFLAARTIKAPKSIKEEGISNNTQRLLVYCPKSTHTWIEKAVVLFGLGTQSIRWIPITPQNQMDNQVLEQTIKDDLQNGAHPLMVIGNAGDVSTGAVDDLEEIAAICKCYDLWFHVDGAYGVPAAVIPDLAPMFKGLEQADSIAMDPHKWLYSPLEAGCVLVKDPNHLIETYSSHPVYYNFSNNDEPATQNYYEYGLQNSRGFRALKVWLTLQQVGKDGYIRLISDDIMLAKLLFELAGTHSELEPVSQQLSITTFRYLPAEKEAKATTETQLNELNEKLLNELQRKGEVFLSNAVVDGKYCLRCCIVNFRTTEKDIRETIDIVVREGRRVYEAGKP